MQRRNHTAFRRHSVVSATNDPPERRRKNPCPAEGVAPEAGLEPERVLAPLAGAERLPTNSRQLCLVEDEGPQQLPVAPDEPGADEIHSHESSSPVSNGPIATS